MVLAWLSRDVAAGSGMGLLSMLHHQVYVCMRISERLRQRQNILISEWSMPLSYLAAVGKRVYVRVAFRR